MSIPVPDAVQYHEVTWNLGHAKNGTTSLAGARGRVKFEATVTAVAYSEVTILPAPVETPVIGGVMTPVELLENTPGVWNWKVTPSVGVQWAPFHVDVEGPVNLASAATMPGAGPVRVVKGDRGAQGASLASLEQIADDTLQGVIHDPLTGTSTVENYTLPRGPVGPYGGTEVTDPQVASYIAAGTATRNAMDARYSQLTHSHTNVKTYGAKGDGRVFYDGSATAGSATLTCPSGTFTSTDVGKRVTITDTADATKVVTGTVAAVTSATSLTMTATAAATVAGSLAVVSNDTTAFQAAITACPKGGVVYVPAGVYGITTGLTLLDNKSMIGDGYEYSLVERTVSRGSVLLAVAPMTGSAVLTAGKAHNGLEEIGNGHSRIEHLAVDGQNIAAFGILVDGYRKRVRFVQAWRGIQCAMRMQSQNGMVESCIIGQQSIGNALHVQAGDVKILGNDIRQGGGHQIYAYAAADLVVMHNHLYGAFNGWVTNGPDSANIYLDNPPNSQPFCVNINDNLFDGTNGPHVWVKLRENTYMTGLSFQGNQLLQNTGWPSGEASVMRIDIAAGSSLRGYAIHGTTGTASGGYYKAILEKTGEGALTHGSMTGNAIRGCLEFWVGQRPEAVAGNVIARTGASTFATLTENAGKETQSVPGQVKVFLIPHGLAKVPRTVHVAPGSLDAAAEHFVTVDASTIRVEYLTVRPTGTSNMVWHWSAAL